VVRSAAGVAVMTSKPLLPDVVIPRALFDFLMGVGEINGTSFGDLNEGLPGRFWWRALLRTAEVQSALNLPAPPEMVEGWQPIETAPRDGTFILACFEHPHRKYNSHRPSDYIGVVSARWIDHNGGGWTWHGISGHVTHWRPLPAPPSIGDDNDQ
jgi:hypothetical protein